MTFLKKVKIKESSIPNAGLGVFTDIDIQKGELIYVEDNLRILTKNMIEKLLAENPTKEVLDLIFIHGQFNSEIGLLTIHTDTIRFINHSDTDYNVYFGRALKFIKQGQELLENYNHVDEGIWYKNLSKFYGYWNYSDVKD